MNNTDLLSYLLIVLTIATGWVSAKRTLTALGEQTQRSDGDIAETFMTTMGLLLLTAWWIILLRVCFKDEEPLGNLMLMWLTMQSSLLTPMLTKSISKVTYSPAVFLFIWGVSIHTVDVILISNMYR